MAKIKSFNSMDALLGVNQVRKDHDITLLQATLKRFGYLRTGYVNGEFCRGTEKAVRRFQRFYGLKVDGVAGPKTKEALMQPRCGIPDENNDYSSSFVLRGCKYSTLNLTYAFENDSADLPTDQARDIIRGAFNEWAKVSLLNFAEVSVNQNPTFRIAWVKGDHGDGSPFDGPGNVLAHAFFPPPCGGPHAGELHFDEAEKFSATAGDGIHLGAVSLHEIGHLLGLSHSEDPSAIMFPTYSSSRLQLDQDDINGINELYGQQRLYPGGQVNGYLSGDNDSALFTIELVSQAFVILDGPGNADFDLYIKREAAPTTTNYDLRAWTVSSDESLRITPESRPFLYSCSQLSGKW